VAASTVVGIGSPKFTAGIVSKFIISVAVSTGAGSLLNLGYYSATVPAAVEEIDVTAEGAADSVCTLADLEYSVNTVNSATLSLGADNSCNKASTVSIAATGATLGLAFGGSDTVDKLFIGGVQQPAGE
jgi:hypothetical protein